ncbi:glycosyltransferase family 2 protein [Candidatus Parcubacteria bacterium]|nr:glycosyltransferase family 2 protein [Candidatus Parcubacteria bacterium]
MPKNNSLKNQSLPAPELSVVILCYFLKKEIFNFVNKVKADFKNNNINNYELILVANFLENSHDPTHEYAEQISKKNNNIKSVCKVKKGMMGWDMKSGFKKTSGKFIAVIDGDGQMPIKDLVRVYKKIKNNNFDLVKTYRLTRGDGLWRKTISTIYNLIFIALFPGLKTKDINSKPKIFTRDFYNKLNLKSDDWFIDAEIMINARRLKAKIAEIPTEFLGLCGKRKSFVRLPTVFEFIKNLILFRIREFKITRKKHENINYRR